MVKKIQTVNIKAIGIGRKDYSKNVELAVESSIRSHLRRAAWSGAFTDVPTVAFPEAQLVALPLLDAEGNIVWFVPEDVKYLIYGTKTSGKRNALTLTGIARIDSWDALIVEEICNFFGYGKSEIYLSKGHILEPGWIYCTWMGQWSEFPAYDISYQVSGMSDVLIEGS